MFKVIASVAALVAGGACLGYAYAMDSVEEHLKKQDEYNKEIVNGLQNIVDELKKLGRDDIMVCIGGVIPVQDYDNLYEHGAVAIFAPGTNIPEAGIKLLTLLIARAKEEAAG